MIDLAFDCVGVLVCKVRGACIPGVVVAVGAVPGSDGAGDGRRVGDVLGDAGGE